MILQILSQLSRNRCILRNQNIGLGTFFLHRLDLFNFSITILERKCLGLYLKYMTLDETELIIGELDAHPPHALRQALHGWGRQQESRS